MTNEERLQKLIKARDLIREVEFSYPTGSDIRQALYRHVVNISSDGWLDSLKSLIREEKRKKDRKRNFLNDI